MHEILIEESVIGWKEYELEVMRDKADNFVVICSIENFDPMGIHTGDSVTVAPAQTLTDREYQMMRNAARAIIREVGVETGGSNIQFAVDPKTGRMTVIEMNPRVSRSSALASKATGFPIAKIAALLAIGYRLDEIQNDITRVTPAAFEPVLDYVVVKIPRWAFEKFRDASPMLGTQMKSVGEVMAIGRTFKEALQKGLRGLEIGSSGFARTDLDDRQIKAKLLAADPDRIFYVKRALDLGWDHAGDPSHDGDRSLVPRSDAADRGSGEEDRHGEGISHDAGGCAPPPAGINDETLRHAKRMGFSDARLAQIVGGGAREADIRARRLAAGIKPVYKRVDTCAGEFESHTPYLYSTYETECEADPTDRKKVMILGSGPNRIGQGIEFDYCCCHAAFAFKDEGYETIMVNCNPETVSTDYDTSDRLYFEPLTFEDVMNIVELEKPEGVVIQFGGQTPLRLALPLFRAGVKILGTSPDAIDLAEDRKRFSALLTELDIPQPESGTASSLAEAKVVADRIGYPVLVRPSYVLGGRAMAIVYDDGHLEGYVREAVLASPEHPILVDRFLEDAYEVDVDAVGDGERVVIGGILQHIEEAGVHSGDSAMVLPTYKISAEHLDTIRRYTRQLGKALAGAGADERAVRDQGRRRLRPGSEPARLAHHALRQQGDGSGPGQGGGADHGRPLAGRPGPHRGPHRAAHLREGIRLPVPQAAGERHPARAGDEVDGRGHGRSRRTSGSPSPSRSPPPATRSPPAAPSSSASTTTTRPRSCPWSVSSRKWASRSWPPGAPPSSSPRGAWPRRWSTR